MEDVALDEICNPGERVREFLEKTFPSDFNDRKSVIGQIDKAFYADGQLASVIYRSTINYLTRRLVSAAVYVRRKSEKLQMDEGLIEIEIRRFINTVLNFDDPMKIAKLASLLLVCTRMRRNNISSALGKKIKEGGETLCYMCGRPLNFDTPNEDDWAELEHVFPRSLGGSSRMLSNIRYACSKCNKAKKSHIDDSDFHYEQICFVNDEEDGDNFWGDFSRPHKIALWGRNGFSCQFCGKPASRVGPLHFIRNDSADSWHFINIEAYCSAHILMIKKRRVANG